MGFKLKLKTRSQAVIQDFCEKCGQFGHTHRDCGMGVTCYKCGEVGHHGRNCTKDIYVESAAVKSAIEQGIYVQGEGLDARRTTGNESITNWNDRAEADKSSEPVVRTQKSLQHYETRENKKYDLVMTPSQQYQRDREVRKKEKKLRKQTAIDEAEKSLIESEKKKDTFLPPPPPPPLFHKQKTKLSREEEKEARRMEERTSRDDLKKAKITEERSEQEISAEKALKRKIAKQGEFFTMPPGTACRRDKKLYFSVERDGQPITNWDLSKHPFYIIGKNDAVVDFTLEHQSVSRTHLVIFHNPTSLKTFIQDLGSQWGTKLNGNKLTAKSPHEISIGDTITVGCSSRSLILQEKSMWG